MMNTMTHEQVERFLPEIALGSESGVEAGVEQHVARCERCQDWLETYQLVGASFQVDFEGGEQHLSSEQLAQEATGVGRDHGDAVAQAHLASCRQCSGELEIARAALNQHTGPVVESSPNQGRMSPAFALIAAGLAAALGLVFWTGRPEVAPPADYLLSERALSGTEVFAADSSITVLDTEVGEGADVTLRAGETVSLGDGFSVESGGSFSIEITSENPS